MLHHAMRMCLAVCVTKGRAYSEIISISGISSTESSVLAHESASEASSLWGRGSSVVEGIRSTCGEQVYSGKGCCAFAQRSSGGVRGACRWNPELDSAEHVDVDRGVCWIDRSESDRWGVVRELEKEAFRALFQKYSPAG